MIKLKLTGALNGLGNSVRKSRIDDTNDKSTTAKDDDYCFVAILGREKGIVMQGWFIPGTRQ